MKESTDLTCGFLQIMRGWRVVKGEGSVLSRIQSQESTPNSLRPSGVSLAGV